MLEDTNSLDGAQLEASEKVEKCQKYKNIIFALFVGAYSGKSEHTNKYLGIVLMTMAYCRYHVNVNITK